MRRFEFISLLSFSLTIAALGGTRPASASAFLAISAPNWAYAAAYAASPAGAAYFWGLSVGAGSTAYAYAYSYRLPFGAAAAYAIARAGVGWRGAFYARGIADPQGDLGMGIPDIGSTTLTTLVNNQDSSDLATEVANDAGGSYSPGYTIDTDTNGEIDGITFNNSSGSETNGANELALYIVNGSAESAFCAAVGDTGCSTESGQTTQSGDVTSLSGLTTDLGSDILDTETELDPTLSGTWSFPDIPGTTSSSLYILVEQSDDTSVPEPGSMLLLGAGVATLGLIARRRRAA